MTLLHLTTVFTKGGFMQTIFIQMKLVMFLHHRSIAGYGSEAFREVGFIRGN